ncbi:MAG: ExeM/NucH family extracellular endonuclease [Okeania sp. SIO2G4]|uniref:ExeM/NucH family extracellular endonuclease n=1 Tax=unclassified Okeania TaxID=2634635 RepID=UPI0013B960FD|nr:MULTISPECIES: ExeM/NucH family extracellular endonuclease [unclassified Okeania]NEP70434.1 ExeM/NucH family extracellular endonuclease [Okeania sp. SIO2G5]NEP91654.1 ExeM/NucH family extracellular endonuclease [Okeania sp. SIO2F5]NEQ89656.1 ExeM/NucH family extracellular endonuclease [Okeania sp. SIO2G4]
MAATTLSSGDIAIIGFNFDNPDEFAFTPLVDIGAGTEINFTDNGWQAAGSFRANEGTFTWTAPTDITAGTIINPTVSSIAFSVDGDQIIAYQGDSSNPTFIYGLNSQGNPGVWQSDSTSPNTSALPTGLVNGETAVALDEIDNAIYTGITSGTQAELLDAISDNSNWSGSNSTRQIMPTNPFTVSGSSGGSNLVINEVLGSTTGTDVEFIELFGQAGTSLDGLSIIVVESDAGSSNGNIDKRVDLGAEDVIGDNGFFLIGNTQILENSVYGVTPNQEISSNFVENSSYTIALVETSSLAGSSVSGSEVVIDTVGVTDGGTTDSFFFNAPVLGPDGSFLPAGVRRVADGVDTDTIGDWVFGDFSLGSDNTPTAGTSDNGGGTGETKLISEIQGSGTSSPLEGQTVTIEAVVVGDYQDGASGTNGDLNGFFVQEEDSDADADPLTSEGLFIFDGDSPAVDVNIGDVVQVTGTVDEFFGLTQLTDVSFSIQGTDTLPTPATVNFPVTTVDDLEAFEGMGITIPDTLFVTEYFNLDRFGEIVLSSDGASNEPGTDGRLEQFTDFNAPDVAGFAAYQEEISKRRIVLDDGQTVQNPSTIIHGRGGNPLSSTNTLRGGDTVDNLSGVLSFGFGDYRVQPVNPIDFQATNPRPETPEDVGGDLTVASINVLNFFTTLDEDGNPGSGPNSLSPRGADNQDEFDRQVEKLVTTLEDIDADIVGLVELENEFGSDQNGDGQFAIETLVDELNNIVGAGTYAYVDPGVPFVDTSDAISVGAIYKTDSVQVAPGTTVEVLTDSDLPALGLGGTVFDGEDTNRAPLAVTFEELATGERLTVSVNHFKSKGGTGTGDDADAGDGQGNFNGTRLRASQALNAWLETDPTGSGDSDFLIVGDLNAYAQEDPITSLEAEGYTDLIEEFVGSDAYSFVFDGQFGYLDYALANQSLLSQVTGTTQWHVNADEPDALDYNLDFGRDPSLFNGQDPFRNSDHDPIIVGLNLESSTPGEVIEGTRRRDNLIGTDGDDTITGFRNRDVLTGGGGDDTFVYTSIVDARDIITDFEVGSDKIDLAGVLDGFGFVGVDPIADGYVGFRSRRGNTILTIDPDGAAGDGSARSFLLVQGVNSAELNNPDNFIF